MSRAGAPASGMLDGHGLEVAVVAASWHEDIMAGLIAGALRVLGDAGAESTVFRVAGSFELPLSAQACARTGRFAAVVALGVVIRGVTPHFDYVCSAATEGLLRVSLQEGIPVGFGLLTCDDEAQARERAGLPGSAEDKGGEAAWAALATAAMLRDLQDR